MPIIHLCSKPEEMPASGKNLRKLEGHENLYTYETHHGLCIRDREMNGYDDSDWYMLIWNEEKGKPEEIMFATTRGWSYPCYASSPDATPEIMAKYNAWEAEEERKYRERKAAEEAATPRVGKTLKVVRGRKVPIGTTGVCIWIGVARFGYKVTHRVGIKDAAGTAHWTAMTNVEVVPPAELSA